MRLISTILVALLLTACGSARKEKLLDRTFLSARAQAVGYLYAIKSMSQSDDFEGSPKPKIEPTQPPGYLPILADEPPQAWSVVMHYGPGKNQITVEAFGDNIAQPRKSETVGSN